MNETPIRMYSFLDAIHYENIDLYDPTNEYFSAAEATLPGGWSIKKKAFWTMCTPPQWESIGHGWKIHVSSVPENAVETLAIVARLLAEKNIAFKFCSDPRMLKMSLGKNWSRFQAGKFIAIYPKDEDEFKAIIDDIHGATGHLAGPHILTDRAYRDSQVVFYRYGAHSSERRVDPYGIKMGGFRLDDGSWYDDVRGPTFRIPPGYVDPFTHVTASKPRSAAPVLLRNRYLIKGVLKYNATGGIYYGTDTQTGREIVIREVRGMLGHLESEMPEDPAYILRREARILKKLSPTGLVPEFIDLFQEWKHWFLVEERLDAFSLWGKSMEFYYAIENQNSSLGFDRILSTIETIAKGLHTIHEHGIVLRDLTRTNIMFTKDGQVKFIDFEFAYELEGGGQWVKGWTPGYASREQVASQKPTVQEDYYAFGALILDLLTFCASGLELGRDAILNKKLKQVLADLSLPMQLHDIVVGLTDLDVNKRWNIQQSLSHFNEMKKPSDEIMMFPAREQLLKIDPPDPALDGQFKDILDGLQRYLDTSLDLSRKDRLWPSCVQAFLTDPMSLQYGATGVAAFLQRSRGHVDTKILDWIEDRTASALCPPGLFSGLGGSALLLLGAGRVDSAQKMMGRIAKDKLTFAVPGLYFGCAGWGLLNLHFWQQTGETKYLEDAVAVGEWLLREAKGSAEGVYWLSDGLMYLGLGDGQSGTALFLTYLGAATHDQRYVRLASRALDFDIAHNFRVAGRITWRFHADSKDSDPNLPHTRFGSAGVGTACIRHFALTGDVKYKEVALDCAFTVRSRVTDKIWQDSGNAGFGEFMLDMQHFLNDDRYRDIAYYQAEAILPHALEFPTGIAFAGPPHQRICCDYATGGAGIGIFFDRLLGRKPRFLMLDDLLRKKNAGVQPEQKLAMSA
jgi:serine/threonine protein kinase